LMVFSSSLIGLGGTVLCKGVESLCLSIAPQAQ